MTEIPKPAGARRHGAAADYVQAGWRSTPGSRKDFSPAFRAHPAILVSGLAPWPRDSTRQGARRAGHRASGVHAVLRRRTRSGIASSFWSVRLRRARPAPRSADAARYPSTRTPPHPAPSRSTCASGTHARTASAAASAPCSRTQTSTLGPGARERDPEARQVRRRGRAAARASGSSAARSGSCMRSESARGSRSSAPGGEQVDEQRRALQAVDRVGARDLGSQRLAGLLCAQGVDRHDEHEPEARGWRDAARERGIAAERDREAAEDRGGDVVGVPLDLDGERQQRVGVDRLTR